MRKRSRAALVAITVIGLGATAGTSQPAVPSPTFVSPAGHRVSSFALAAGLDGRAVVTWTAADRHDITRIWVSDRAPGGAFRPPVALSDPARQAWNRTAAVAPDGTELVGWVEERRNSPQSFVVVAARPPGAPFGKPHRLATHARGASQLRLAFGADGTAIAAWVQETAKYVGRVAVAVRTPAGHWLKPEMVTDTERTVSNPQVALDGTGTATLVWDRAPPPNKPTILHAARQAGDAQVRAAVRPRGGTFGGYRILSNPHHQATDAFLAENARGDAAVVWRMLPSRRDPVRFRIAFAYRRGDGRFGGHHLLGTRTHGFSFPRAAIDPDGVASFVWGAQPTQAELNCDCVRIFAARRPPGGPVGKPTAISPHAVTGPEIATGPSGGALVLWTPDSVSRKDFRTRVEGRFVAADGTLGPRRRLSTLGRGMDAEGQGALSGADRAVVAWTRYFKGHSHLEVIDTEVP